MTWIEQVRRRQAARRLRFFVWLALALIAQTVVLFACYAVARFALGVVALSPPFLVWCVTSIGTAAIVIFTRIVRPLPFKGDAPEEAAAKAFFQATDVRSDDNNFEKDLQP